MRREAGFTLLEVMVAFAIAALASLVRQHVRAMTEAEFTAACRAQAWRTALIPVTT